MNSADKANVTISANGRICLFGDHQDYLGLPVIASTIGRSIRIKAKANSSHRFVVDLPDIGEQRSIELDQEIGKLKPRDYLLSGVKVMQDEGLEINRGYDIEVSGDIPINSGLSSSSALCVAWIRFLVQAFSDRKFSPSEIGHFAYRAEVVEHKEPGGIMDQYTIAHEGLVYIETAPPYHVSIIKQSIPGLIVADSGLEKGTIDVLTEAKQGGLKALAYLKTHIKSENIDSVRPEELKELMLDVPADLRPYLKAAIGNHDITRKALRELRKSKLDINRIGELMNAHHEHLRNDLKVSTPELDSLIRASLEAGAVGAKLLGSGGGGCILVLAPGKEDQVMHALKNAGAEQIFEV